MQKLLKAALCLLCSSLFLLSVVTVLATDVQSRKASLSKVADVPITVNFQNKLLRDALDEIRTKSGLGIIYNDEDVPADLYVTYRGQSTPVKEVLQQMLKGTKLGFKEYKDSLVIYVKEQASEKKTVSQGSLQGRLSDAEKDEPLFGATIMIIGTGWGATTDIDGRYTIKGVPGGTYQLGISYIGYESVVVRDVNVIGGQSVTFDYKLKPAATQLQDVEIIGDKALSGNVVETNEVSMVSSFRNSPLIITGISAQQIARSVDQDAGQVARRLPGVAVLNNFVNIRGMHERYNLTYLNGVVAPSSETDTRAFSYDMLPAGIIDKMTVYRSPAPELLADWAGGVVKIETKNTSIARQLEFNTSIGYRPGSSFKDYYKSESGKRDWLGMDDGARGLPDGFPAANQIPAGGYADVDIHNLGARDDSKFTDEQHAQNAAWGRKMYNKWNLQKGNRGLDYRAGINYYDAVMLGKMRLSNLTSISTSQTMQILHQEFVPQEEGADRTGFVKAGRFFKDTISQAQARWSVVQNLSLGITPAHRVEAKFFFNQLGTDETMMRNGFDGIYNDEPQYQTRILYTYRSRSVMATQLAGSHALGKDDKHNLQWAAGYGYSKDETPAQRMLQLIPEDPNLARDPTAKRSLINSGADAFSLSGSQYYTEASEKNRTLSLDYTLKLPWSSSFVKIGGFNEVKHRDQDARMIGFGGLPLTGTDGSRFSQWNAEQMYDRANFKDDGSGAYLFDNQMLSGLFNVEGNLMAAYAAVNIPLLNKRLNIYGGLRYEGQDLRVTVPDESQAVLTDRYLYYWLPSVNASWNFTDQVLLRAAYGKTLNRPNFRELMTYLVNDPRLDRVFIGDSSLVDATIHNFDLRLEYYPSPGEFISVGVYYKKLYKAIEPYIQSLGSTERINFNNTPESLVYGIEAEIRKSFDFLPVSWGRRLSVISNLALLKSKVEFTDGLFTKGVDDYRVFSRPLEGTASFVVNAGLYYDHEEWGTKISALYNVLGQRLIVAPTDFFPAYYERPRHVLDLTIRQRITKHVELRAGVQDILNQAVSRYADYDRNERWSRDERSKWPYKDWMFQQFKPGSYYMLGLNVTL